MHIKSFDTFKISCLNLSNRFNGYSLIETNQKKRTGLSLNKILILSLYLSKWLFLILFTHSIYRYNIYDYIFFTYKILYAHPHILIHFNRTMIAPRALILENSYILQKNESYSHS